MIHTIYDSGILILIGILLKLFSPSA